MSRTDINRVAQTILIPLLAEVYGYTELKNLDSPEEPNYPAIDLGDETARVSFQVTSTSGSEKIKKTLRKFVERELYEKYDKLIIYILTEKQDSYSGKGYEEIIQGKFTFDKDKDIWDYRDILREVANFQIDKACKVESILEANFGEGRRPPEWEVVDKVEEVINESTQLFVGRSEEFQKLDEFLRENSSGVKLVKAGAGFGKTALLANWVNGSRGKDCFIAYHFFSQRYDVTRSVARAYRNLLRQLYTYYELSYEQPPNDENQLRETLYSILRERGAREDKPLVIALDGLDEAERPFSPPFPTPLPENVFVIASARAEEGEKPEYLRDWIDSAESIRLNRLCRGAIANWLRQTGEGELAAFAEDAYFVAQLDEITQGFPLYLRYLIEELIQAQQKGEDVQVVLTRSPKGFGAYVQEQFQRLAQVEEIRRHREVRELFALLSVALGALSEDDIQELTDLNEWDLAALPWQATRWFSIQTGFYSFAHPLLAQEFQGVLKRQASSAMDKLIRYCSRWQEHQRRYALRHYAEHLREAKRWEELYAIARNEDFAATQQKHLPDEPDLPLKTVQTALLGAAEKDNAGAMADFMLVHARRLEQTTVQESPLDALRLGSLDCALALADLYEIERCVLWYLLLVWELKDKGKSEDARKTLERLQRKELPRFSLNSATLGYGDYAAYLLAYVFALNQDTYTIIVYQLLDNHHRRILCKILSEHGDFDALKAIVSSQAEEREFINYADRLETAEEINNQREPQDNLWTRAYAYAKAENFPTILKITEGGIDGHTQIEALGFIAKALAEEGNSQTARATFAVALQITQGVEPAFSQALALADIAVEQVKVEREVGANTARIAHQIAQKINDPTEQAIATALIAEVIAKADNGEEAKTIFDSASEIAQTIKIQQKCVNSFTAIAKAQVRVKKFADACKTAQKIEFPWRKAKVLAVIAKAQAEAEPGEEFQTTLTAAIEFAQGIPLEGEGIEVLIAIAEAQSVRDNEMGLSTLTNLLEVARASRERAKHLSKIAAAQAKLGEITTALTTADEIEDKLELVKALSWIALAQFKKGKKQELSTTLTAALQTKDKIKDKQKLMRALKTIAGIQAMAGEGEEAVRTAETILTERNLYLPGIASWLVETGDQENFKKLLIPCAYYLDAAYQMCRLLARLYPEKAEEIAKVVSECN